MIIDDSITIKGNAIGTSQAVTTADCIDRRAAGTCLCGFPTFACYLTQPIPNYAGKGSLTLCTCDTPDGAYEDVKTVHIPTGTFAGGKVGKVAQIDMPKEGVKRYVKFRLDLSAAPTTGGVFEILAVPGAAVGL